MGRVFTKFSTVVAGLMGSPWAFLIAAAIIAVWALSGPLFGWSDTWQLVINTGTTIVTFLMVFLIQNTQNRDAKAVHVKLDELIRSLEGARENLMDIEDRTEEEIDEARQRLLESPAVVTRDTLEYEVREHAYPVAKEVVADYAEARQVTGKNGSEDSSEG